MRFIALLLTCLCCETLSHALANHKNVRSSSARKLRRIWKRQDDLGYLDQCSILQFWDRQIGRVNVLAFFDSSWQFSHRQAAMLRVLRERFERTGFRNIQFFAVNAPSGEQHHHQQSDESAESTEQLEAEEETWRQISPSEAEGLPPVSSTPEALAEALGSGVYFIQDDEQLQIWPKLRPFRDQILVIDRCGRLTYQVIVPWSILHFPYVKAAILSTYKDEPCGYCEFKESPFDTTTAADSSKAAALEATTTTVPMKTSAPTTIPTTTSVPTTILPTTWPGESLFSRTDRPASKEDDSDNLELKIEEAIEAAAQSETSTHWPTSTGSNDYTSELDDQTTKVATTSDELSGWRQEYSTESTEPSTLGYDESTSSETESSTDAVPTTSTAYQWSVDDEFTGRSTISSDYDLLGRLAEQEGTTNYPALPSTELPYTRPEQVTPVTTAGDTERRSESSIGQRYLPDTTTLLYDLTESTVQSTSETIVSLPTTTTSETLEASDRLNETRLQDGKASSIIESIDAHDVLKSRSTNARSVLPNQPMANRLEENDKTSKPNSNGLPIRIIMRAPHVDEYSDQLAKSHEYLVLKTGEPDYHEHLEEAVPAMDRPSGKPPGPPSRRTFDKDESPGLYGEVADYWRNFSNEQLIQSGQANEDEETEEDEEDGAEEEQEHQQEEQMLQQQHQPEKFGATSLPALGSATTTLQKEPRPEQEIELDTEEPRDDKPDVNEDADLVDEEAKSKLIAHYSKLLPWLYYVLAK